MSRTIAAVATPAGNSGVGIVRVSGPKAAEVVCKMFTPSDKKPLVPRRATFGVVYGEGWQDSCIVIYFKGPHSFTGEDTVEIQAHGGFFLLNKILETAIGHGAKLAVNGEFSRTAFLNGKMSLDQAESVIEIINAESDMQLKYAQTVYQGHLNVLLAELEKELISVTAQIEATLDYPEDDIEKAAESSIKPQIEKVADGIRELHGTARTGKIVSAGIRVAVLGKPNVGKSTLFNALLGSDRSIVTDIAGTTTDVITESVLYKGVKIIFADTAGLHNADGKIEKLGEKRTRQTLDESDIALAVFDASSAPDDYDAQILALCKGRISVCVLNKSDIKNTMHAKEWKKLIALQGVSYLVCSAATGENIGQIKQAIFEKAALLVGTGGSQVVITNMRHAAELERADVSLRNALANLGKVPLDCIAADITAALDAVGAVTGTRVSEAVLDEVFSRFCLGK